jgi:hypothetical protein
MDRLKRIGILIALLITGVVIVSLIAGFQQLLLHPEAMLGSIAIAALMVLVILLVALVPSRRFTTWVRSIIGPNGRYLFIILIFLWIGGMAFLASLNLGPQQIGSPALVGLFAGIFLFMGFIWSVIGE